MLFLEVFDAAGNFSEGGIPIDFVKPAAGIAFERFEDAVRRLEQVAAVEALDAHLAAVNGEIRVGLDLQAVGFRRDEHAALKGAVRAVCAHGDRCVDRRKRDCRQGRGHDWDQ
ncbi:MAG: hypothetical protein QM754_11630 [Tepidisphaeraceae bacterium]